MATVTIKPGAATEDAKSVESIVTQITSDMETLNAAMTKYIADDSSQSEGIITNWSTKVRDNWEAYYTNDIPTAMGEMKLSAANLEVAVKEALAFSNEA